MASIRFRYFASPATLRSIEPSRLIRLLEEHRVFFDSIGRPLPAPSDPESINYQGLVDTFASPNESMPAELLDALFLIDEMSDETGMDSLMNAATNANLDLESGDDHSPADIAVQVWLSNREILEAQHAIKQLKRPKSFQYFQATTSQRLEFLHPTTERRDSLERSLDDWFEEKRRGRGTRVFIYEDQNEVRFLIRHGRPYSREETLNGSAVESVCYRPIKYDVVVYDRRLQELRINAELVGEKNLYSRLIGQYFFTGPDCFPGTNKYSMEPLRENGEDSLSCSDVGVDGIEWIKLTEVSFYWGGPHGEIEVRKSGDLFASLAARGGQLPSRPRILKAAFKVKFVDSKTPRSVTIHPSNIAQYSRDADAQLIERWLELRGFILSAEEHENEQADVSLARA
jgi:hypothetical protein